MAGASKTYRTSAIVLRKTKLGERDTIVTLVGESGALIRGVAKGARKPGGSYAARLELFHACDLMLAKGKSLDVITDARLHPGAPGLSFGVEQAACASMVAELLADVCQEGLDQPRLYEMGLAAFARIGRSLPTDALALSCAVLLKIVSTAGFRPLFDRCCICQSEIDLQKALGKRLFSVQEGGTVCPDCAPGADGVPADNSTLSWAQVLLYSRFDEMASFSLNVSILFGVLQLMKPWLEFYAGRRLKSADFVLTCGLF